MSWWRSDRKRAAEKEIEEAVRIEPYEQPGLQRKYIIYGSEGSGAAELVQEINKEHTLAAFLKTDETQTVWRAFWAPYPVTNILVVSARRGRMDEIRLYQPLLRHIRFHMVVITESDFETERCSVSYKVEFMKNLCQGFPTIVLPIEGPTPTWSELRAHLQPKKRDRNQRQQIPDCSENLSKDNTGDKMEALNEKEVDDLVMVPMQDAADNGTPAKMDVMSSQAAIESAMQHITLAEGLLQNTGEFTKEGRKLSKVVNKLKASLQKRSAENM